MATQDGVLRTDTTGLSTECVDNSQGASGESLGGGGGGGEYVSCVPCACHVQWSLLNVLLGTYK